MAGAIHFYTKKNIQTKISTTSGNYGTTQTSASVGINDEKIDLNISIDNSLNMMVFIRLLLMELKIKVKKLNQVLVVPTLLRVGLRYH